MCGNRDGPVFLIWSSYFGTLTPMKPLGPEKKSIRKIIFIALALGVAFFLALHPPLDPDLGWHIRTGQYIWEHKNVPATDSFSYTFPEYPVIAHEWLTDLGLYGLAMLGWPVGLLLAALVFSGLAVAAYGIAAKTIRTDGRLQAMALLLSTVVSAPFLGIRPQVISLLGLSLVIYALYRFARYNQRRALYMLPAIFLLWANLHGGFALGLFAFGLFIASETSRLILKRWYQSVGELITKRTPVVRTLEVKNMIRLIAVGIASGLATLVNPYGLRLYDEIYATFVQTTGLADVRSTIGEWQPPSLHSLAGLELLLYGALLLLLVIRNRQKIDYTLISWAFIFFLLALASRRYIPMLLIIVTPLWVLLFQTRLSVVFLRISRNRLVITAGGLMLAAVSWHQVTACWQNGNSPKGLASDYPAEAVQYLASHLPAGEMYNEYDWGGYLIWSLPEKKVFIDGRMAIWNRGPKNVYRDWQAITRLDENWRELLNAYRVNWVFLRQDHRLVELLRHDPAWREVYSDTKATVIIRNTPVP